MEIVTDEEENVILTEVKAGRITARAAIARLVAGGMHKFAAANHVFITLGGDDIINTGKDGIARYDYSGKSVDEVRRLMEK